LTAAQRILTIILGRELFDKLRPFLGRETLDISTATNARGSLVLVRNLAFNLIVVEHPLPDMELTELVQEIRGRGSACRESPLLVLTREDPATLAAALDDPLATCQTLHAGSDELLMLTARCLGIATRRGRLLVQLKVELGAASIQRACQSENISESGLLLRTDWPLPLQTDVELGFSLPYSGCGIRARGRIVRYTDPDAEGLVGLAVHFESISEEDREAIATFIAERSASRTAGAERG
jgi:CheY-like chemotaxis protein